MTNNYERTPNHINSVYADLKTESKYLLTKKDARAVLLVGFSVGCFMLAATLLLAYAVMLSTSINNDEYQMQQALVVYASIWMGIFLMLPGIYCGMYTSLLKISAGQRATASDLFGYYTSPRMFFRSIGIFVRGNWFLLGIGVVLMLTIVSFNSRFEMSKAFLILLPPVKISVLRCGLRRPVPSLFRDRGIRLCRSILFRYPSRALS